MPNYAVTGFSFKDGAQISEIINAQNAEEVKSLYQNDGISITRILQLPEPVGFEIIGFKDGELINDFVKAKSFEEVKSIYLSKGVNII